MIPNKVFAEVFQNFELAEMGKQIDLLLEIALITDNCNFDNAKERGNLFFFKQNLKRCLEAGHVLAEKQKKRLLRKRVAKMEEGS